MTGKSKRHSASDPGSAAGGISASGTGVTPGPSEGQVPNRRLTFAICLFLALAVWAVFGQTRHFEFVNYDDDDMVYEHPVIKHGLSWQGIVWVFTHSDDGHWAPVNKLSHMLDCQLYGLQPGGHHLTNVLLHTATAILLFLVLQKMTVAPWPSAFVAAVFAIHPLRVESVAWVAERKDVLSGFFFLLTLICYASFAQKSEARNQKSETGNPASGLRLPASGSYGLALFFFACGLMTKAMVITLPLLLLLLDYWPLRRWAKAENRRTSDTSVPTLGSQPSTLGSLVLEKVPFLVLIALAGVGLLLSRDRNNVVVAAAWQSGQGMVPHRNVSEMVGTGQSLLTPFIYLKQMFFPTGLSVFYPVGQSVPVEEMVLAGTALLAVSAAVLIWRRAQPYLAVGWFWYLIMLAPVMILIQRGAEVRCDRYTYLPQIGLYVMATWGAWELCRARRYRGMVLGSAAGAVLGGLLACAFVQTERWQNSTLLWTYTLTRMPDNYVANDNFGIVLANQGRQDEAIERFERSLQTKPDYADGHYNLAIALLRKGRVDDALSHLRQAVQIRRDYPDALNNLAWLLATYPDARLRDGAQAVQFAERACTLTHYQETMMVGTLAAAYAEAGRFDEAVTAAQKACALAAASGQPELLKRNQELLELYRQRQPYHEAMNP